MMKKVVNPEYQKILRSTLFPLMVIVIMWIVKVAEWYTKSDFSKLGINPKSVDGLLGIIIAPFIHADFGHLIANTIPFFITLSIIFYFYKEIALKVFFLIWIFTNIWVWSFAVHNTYHIGASGLVYGFVSFLLFSGLIRRNARLMAISMLIIFLYGGLFWGIFPDFFPHRNISWESHLMGGFAGLVMAVFYRKTGVQKELYSWDLEEEQDDDDNDYYLDLNQPGENQKPKETPKSPDQYLN
jgi:membrane associated rhomboid family serine protease